MYDVVGRPADGHLHTKKVSVPFVDTTLVEVLLVDEVVDIDSLSTRSAQLTPPLSSELLGLPDRSSLSFEGA